MSVINLTPGQEKLLLSAERHCKDFNTTNIDFDAVATELGMKRKSAVDTLKRVLDRIKASNVSVKLTEAEEKLVVSAIKNAGDFNTKSIDFDAVATELGMKRKSAVDTLKRVLSKIKADNGGTSSTIGADDNATGKKGGAKRKLDAVSESGDQASNGSKKAREAKVPKASPKADADEDDEVDGQIKYE